MKLAARLIIVLLLAGVAAMAPRSHAFADCSGITCEHWEEVYVSGSPSLLYNEGHLAVNPGTTREVDEYMQRDVYPYGDAQGVGYGGPIPCASYTEHTPLNGYGRSATYQFKTYFSAQRCDGSSAFAHYHPYNPSGGYWSLGYWSGGAVYCRSNEPPGTMSC